MWEGGLVWGCVCLRGVFMPHLMGLLTHSSFSCRRMSAVLLPSGTLWVVVTTVTVNFDLLRVYI